MRSVVISLFTTSSKEQKHLYDQMFKAKEAISKNIGREILLLPPLQMASLKAPTLPVAKFDTHQVGQGVVYNVIVYDPVTNMEAAYSPAVIYAPNYLRRKSQLKENHATGTDNT